MFLLLQWRHRVTAWGKKMTAVLSRSSDGVKINGTIAAKIDDNTIWQGSKNAKTYNLLQESLRLPSVSHRKPAVKFGIRTPSTKRSNEGPNVDWYIGP